MRMRFFPLAAGLALGLAAFAPPALADAPAKPNILVIMGDDIGYWNISAYNRGMMGYRTPNIDRIANEGAIFTDYYGQQSCTAGRAAFITGQSPMRTGLLKVGLPGAKEGLSDKDPTLADLLKPLGYMTGQFGKNHLGDRNEFLPTVHGFDEFFGNLYHLNAEDEPEHPDYPKNPQFKLALRSAWRSPMHRRPTTETRATTHASGRWGKQNCEDTGPLDKKRMETVDQEFLDASLNFIDRAHRGEEAVLRLVQSEPHAHLHAPEARVCRAVTGLGIYPDGMVEHDGQVGQLLKKLDDLGIADNTIVIYTTDNGASRSPGRMAARRRSAAKRTPTGKAATACRQSFAGPAWSKPRTELNDIFSCRRLGPDAGWRGGRTRYQG